MRPRVSIIIVNWNGLQDTLECLKSLGGIDYDNLEIVLVDNGSDGDDLAVLQETYGDRAHFLRNESNLGYAGGNNTGIAFALANLSPDYLLLLNNDIVVDPAFLRELVETAHSDPGIGIIGPKTLDYKEPDILQQAGTRFWAPIGKVRLVGRGEKDLGQHDRETKTDYVQGSCMLIRREVVETIGLLNEEYFLYWEDMEYCLRATKAGFSLAVCPASRVWHKGSASSGRLSGRLMYFGTRNRFFIYRDHMSRPVFIFFLLYFFGIQFWGTLLSLFFRGCVRDAAFILKGIRDGLSLRRKNRPTPWIASSRP